MQAIHDGTDSNRAALAMNYLGVIADRFARETLSRRLERMSGRLAEQGGRPLRVGRVAVEARAWFNENLESRAFFVPGIIGTILMLVTLMLTSMAIVREKELGTMEQLLVTPIRPLEIVAGKTAPFLLTGLLQAALVMLVARLWFGIGIRGDLPLLLAGILLHLAACLGIGILLSTLAETQQQAMLLTSLVFMPSLLLSGFIFPIANMPAAVQAFTWLVPLRYFLVIVRGIYLKGVGIAVLWHEFARLALLEPGTGDAQLQGGVVAQDHRALETAPGEGEETLLEGALTGFAEDRVVLPIAHHFALEAAAVFLALEEGAPAAGRRGVGDRDIFAHPAQAFEGVHVAGGEFHDPVEGVLRLLRLPALEPGVAEVEKGHVETGIMTHRLAQVRGGGAVLPR